MSELYNYGLRSDSILLTFSALTSYSVLLSKDCPCFVGVDTPPPVPNIHLWTNVPQEIVHTQICDEKQFWKICKSCLVYILKSCPGILAVRVPSQAATESSSQAAGVPHKLLECLTDC